MYNRRQSMATVHRLYGDLEVFYWNLLNILLSHTLAASVKFSRRP